MNKLINVVFNADLRNGHTGLKKIVKDLKISDLGQGEFILFLNSKRSALKLYTGGEIIAHFRNQNNRVMDMGVIRKIPNYFNGTSLRMQDAMADLIKERFKKN